MFRQSCGGCVLGGFPAWSIPNLGRFPNPSVHDGLVFVPIFAGSSYRLQAFAADCGAGAGTCVPLWSYGTDGFVQQQAIPDGNRTIFAVTGDPTGGGGGGDLYAFCVGAVRGTS